MLLLLLLAPLWIASAFWYVQLKSMPLSGAVVTDSSFSLPPPQDRKFYDESEILSPSPSVARGGGFGRAPRPGPLSDKAVPIARLSPNCLEFGELQIRITPSELIGIRMIQDESCDDIEGGAKQFVYGGGVLSSRPSIDTSAIDVAAREKRAARIRQRVGKEPLLFCLLVLVLVLVLVLLLSFATTLLHAADE